MLKYKIRLFVTKSVRYGATLKWIQTIPEEFHWPQQNLESEPLNHPPYDLLSIILSGNIIHSLLNCSSFLDHLIRLHQSHRRATSMAIASLALGHLVAPALG